MTRARALALCLAVLLPAPAAHGRQGAVRAQDIADCISELDVERARRWLDEAPQDSPSLTFERARLSIYQGDCDLASAILSAPAYATTKEGASLGGLARRCAEATAAAIIVQDPSNGLWIRLQDEADRALVPLVSDVAIRARATLQRDLGTDLPRPLRLEIVRDVFSLASLTGLPVEAAETTGTIAVARWGRVMLVTPRAAPHGYPWEDTLAHEIAHLAITRASRDHAPLWLQEGVAKREETRWRSPRPFDGHDYDDVALRALLSGQSVGIDRIGPSIAMLPSADAARIAYAEAESFLAFWLAENGEAALRLLLLDLRGAGSTDPNAAMRSVTGFDIPVWTELWHEHLTATARGARPAPAPPSYDRSFEDRLRQQEAARRVRLGGLLFDEGHSSGAGRELDQAVAAADRDAAVRWRAARAWMDAGEPGRAPERLGDLSSVDGPSGPWFALRGRVLSERGERIAAEQAFELGLALDPFSELVACLGRWQPRHAASVDAAAPPADPARRALCEAARRPRGRD